MWECLHTHCTQNNNPASNLDFSFPARTGVECYNQLPIPGRDPAVGCTGQCDNYGAGFCMASCAQCKFSELMCPARPPYVTPVRVCNPVV